MLGLKRGAVGVYNYEKELKIEVQNTSSCLKKILGNVIKDIQHVRITSILSKKAKPIINIVVSVDAFDDILLLKNT